MTVSSSQECYTWTVHPQGTQDEKTQDTESQIAEVHIRGMGFQRAQTLHLPTWKSAKL